MHDFREYMLSMVVRSGGRSNTTRQIGMLRSIAKKILLSVEESEKDQCTPEPQEAASEELYTSIKKIISLSVENLNAWFSLNNTSKGTVSAL